MCTSYYRNIQQQKAYKATFTAGNVYQASLDFLRSLAMKFQAQPHYVESSRVT